MLAIGQTFKSLKQLYVAVELHEVQTDGAFELTKDTSGNFTRVVCRCSNVSESGNRQCPASIVAEERGSDVIIIDAKLKHCHPGATEERTVGNFGYADEADELMPLPVTSAADVCASMYSETLDEENFEQYTLASSAANDYVVDLHPSALSSQSFLARVPRFFCAKDGGILNLKKFLVRSPGGEFYCPFCTYFRSLFPTTVGNHIDQIHQAEAVEAAGYWFVPCHAMCRPHFRRRDTLPAMHFHCVCGILLLSRRAISAHVHSGVCSAFQPTKSKATKPANGSMRLIRKSKFDAIRQTRPAIHSEVQSTSGESAKRDRISPAKARLSFRSSKASAAAAGITATVTEEAKHAKVSHLEEGEIPPEAAPSRRSSSNVQQQLNLKAIASCTDDFPHKCKVCGTGYKSELELREHRKDHYKSERCRVCEKQFVSLRHLVEHTHAEHPQARVCLPVNLMCTLCGHKLEMVDDLAAHYRDTHNLVDCDIEFSVFENAASFYQWKTELESSSFSYFVRRRRTSSENDVTMFFACFFSWGDNRASLKEKRTERHCPAFIRAVQSRTSPAVEVSYCMYHVGHDLRPERFWKQVQRSLHGLLSFRHKAKTDSRKMELDLTDLGMEEHQKNKLMLDYGRMRDGVPAGDLVALDKQVSVYWEQLREKLEESGNYALSIAGRWSNPAATADPDDKLCRICQVEFKNHKSMMRHMLRIHDPKRSVRHSKYSRPVRCIFCNMQMVPPAMKNLIQHYINAHEQPIQLKSRVFRQMDEFLAWRESVTNTMFRRHKYYQSAQGDSRHYWTCKHSGRLQNPSAGVTEGHCPAWIFAQETPKSDTDQIEIRVSYCLHHIGHELRAHTGNRRSFLVSAADEQLAEAQFSYGVVNQQTPCYSLQQLAVSGDVLVPYIASNGVNWVDERASSVSMLETEIAQLEGVSYQIISSSQLGVDDALGEGNEIVRATISEHGLDNSANNSNGMGIGSVALTSPAQHASGEDMLTSHDNVSTASIFALLENGGNYGDSQNLAVTGSTSTDSAGVRSQISVLIRSADSAERCVKLQLAEFPLVTTKDGKKYFALDETSLVEAVSQVLARQGECLYEGDQLEILQ